MHFLDAGVNAVSDAEDEIFFRFQEILRDNKLRREPGMQEESQEGLLIDGRIG